jgi:hypothetical protein
MIRDQMERSTQILIESTLRAITHRGLPAPPILSTLASKREDLSPGARSFEDRCIHLGGEFFTHKGLLYYSSFINLR